MGSSGVQPSFDSFLNSEWGWGPEGPGILPFSGFSNIVVGTNPPYTATDFLNFYPKFGGTPIQVIAASLQQGITNVVLSQPTPGIAAGQLITGIGIAPGCVVASYTQNTTEVTLSLPATVTADSVQLNFYVDPFVPLLVLGVFIALASSSVIQARWQTQWPFAMALYVAHFCTLYLRSDGDVYSSAGAVAAAGLKTGITISKSAGPVSQGLQQSSGLDGWAEWESTSYGRQFASMARPMGAGPMLVW